MKLAVSHYFTFHCNLKFQFFQWHLISVCLYGSLVASLLLSHLVFSTPPSPLIGSHYIVQASLELGIFSCQPSKHWDYSWMPQQCQPYLYIYVSQNLVHFHYIFPKLSFVLAMFYSQSSKHINNAYWHTHVIPALERCRQEDKQFKTQVRCH